MSALPLYLDTNILVSFFVQDDLNERAIQFLNGADAELLVSDFAKLEFGSAVAQRCRMKLLEPDAAQAALAAFDSWTVRIATRIETAPADLIAAAAAIRRLDTPLRTGDALHIAIADRIGATIATFDRKMTEAALALGVAVTA
ncbi:type II toxin-antitoxin system VapC family toxin [Acidiphilium sp. AL]|uniref:Ribonuclease VapC n=1 Tax=Acidiphilium iwatense TaxID=768198 RepID=A0ABS9DSK9_9PROT|nr:MULTISPECIES: type II toxin-antitoxin system VapC family toxin [Acidiphilium]MCF3945705.1 type II toxin-antitoxin system VapC family toxin [Acidiphilium iwatense]MCU4159285.1 type II toxin-antitoxin system VapC family toxin [Acidiphilium sp. AL]